MDYIIDNIEILIYFLINDINKGVYKGLLIGILNECSKKFGGTDELLINFYNSYTYNELGNQYNDILFISEYVYCLCLLFAKNYKNYEELIYHTDFRNIINHNNAVNSQIIETQYSEIKNQITEIHNDSKKYLLFHLDILATILHIIYSIVEKYHTSILSEFYIYDHNIKNNVNYKLNEIGLNLDKLYIIKHFNERNIKIETINRKLYEHDNRDNCITLRNECIFNTNKCNSNNIEYYILQVTISRIYARLIESYAFIFESLFKILLIDKNLLQTQLILINTHLQPINVLMFCLCKQIRTNFSNEYASLNTIQKNIIDKGYNNNPDFSLDDFISIYEISNEITSGVQRICFIHRDMICSDDLTINKIYDMLNSNHQNGGKYYFKYMKYKTKYDNLIS